MIIASLILNILVLILVCFALITNFEKMQQAAGAFSPARGILLAIFLTLLIASIFLLFYTDVKLALALFSMQIIYKFISPFTVKSIKNPIIISNLFIAVFHLITVYAIVKSNALHFERI